MNFSYVLTHSVIIYYRQEDISTVIRLITNITNFVVLVRQQIYRMNNT